MSRFKAFSGLAAIGTLPALLTGLKRVFPAILAAILHPVREGGHWTWR